MRLCNLASLSYYSAQYISALFPHLGRITSMSFCILLRFRPPSAAPAAAVAAAGCLDCGASGAGGGGGLSLEEATMASLRLASPRRPRLKNGRRNASLTFRSPLSTKKCFTESGVRVRQFGRLRLRQCSSFIVRRIMANLRRF